ncbi:beta-glucan synthesis-associated protein [Punctularia strigosozonata HHB-11173 SS5]|uniref:beta-glucan synthesis-associated protein n=1 Tax=Punctularia strigosozonata (strain HHB-11173) TaxID=741275 RepID=UPI0004417624|nr:beta-glucan synthesis-associated protein [Punctularia strigosozonata HHB-11173 SS5]EIN14053.1 beta-glucan synthesis-associated protein [Punctularia strigosozonata HHB-11173 SS5]
MASENARMYGVSPDAASTTNLLSPSSGGHVSEKSPRFPQGPGSLRNGSSTMSLAELNPSNTGRSSTAPSLSDKFSLSPDPHQWGAELSINHAEPDDFLHNPDPKRDRKNDEGGTIFTYRGITNLGCLLLLALSLGTLFAGYPLITYFTRTKQSNQGGFNLGGTNATGQVPSMPGNWGLIDLETPKDAYYKSAFRDGSEMQLVFSDEFNTDGRTFYPGDDPYWEAVDLHYWGTNNMEWYDPAAITTRNGSLEVTLSKKQTHGLDYQGGMMSTWNKFCFTGGLIEASVVLPGANNILGLWPAIWTMGNLGRAGYGATLDGMVTSISAVFSSAQLTFLLSFKWPYTYDSCDVGTAPNQTHNGLPISATNTGTDKNYNNELSYLQGQRLSRCTCPGESHPGPVHEDGTYVGRAAPEIDIFEAQISGDPLTGQVSQSGQWAPFNAYYQWFNTSDNLIIPDPSITVLNSYTGGVYQQATSGVTQTNQECYELTGNCYSIYGFEYKPGFDGAYISWIADNKVAWTLNQAGMAADTRVEIGPRPVPQEPLYILVNLGMSSNFGFVDLDHLTFPTTMKVDWIRVYQRTDSVNVGCDPPEFPTAAYINQYIDAYTNPNLTTWVNDYKQTIPKNSFLGQC